MNKKNPNQKYKRFVKEYSFKLVENILYIDFGTNVEIDLNYAKRMVKDRLNLLNGKIVLSIADASRVIKISKEARDYFSSDEARRGVKAAALISDNAMTNMLANFFIKVHLVRPKVPTKLFSNKIDAESWIRSLGYD